MSQLNLEKAEISLNERSSITGNSSLHNLTGTRTRFQPVRIKALLSLFDSEDDDTEPRDSDNDSDTESLQALPDDDDDANKSNSSKDEEPSPVKSVSKTVDRQVGVSMIKNVSIEEKNVDNFEVTRGEEFKQTDRRISRNSNSFDLKSNVLSSSVRKPPLAVPFTHVSNIVDGADSNGRISFTPQPTIEPIKQRGYGPSNILSDTKFERRQENLVDFDNQSKMRESLRTSAMETPLKHGTSVTSHQNSCLARRNVFETPQTKSNSEHPTSVVDTPGLIFSHWSRNNFFQTPTHNPIIASKKEGGAGQGQINHQLQDIKLQPHRFSNNENRIVRKPLSEAMHLNQGSSMNENRSNHVPEHQSFAKVDSLTKENCPIDSKYNIKGNVVSKIVQSLQESHRQNDVNQRSLSLANDEKSNCRISLEMGKALPSIMTNVEKDYELISCNNVNPNEMIVRNGCGKKPVLPHNSEGVFNTKNKHIETESGVGRCGSILLNSDGLKIDRPSSANCESNPGNVQFSVPAKAADTKYGKTINVKGSDYVVLGKLGQGMSGEVLRVQEVKTGELRAIKCVDLSCIDKETAQGCLEEVSMLHRLRAPCIINMITYEIQSQLLYVVMEMGDTDLSKLLKSMSREKQLPLTMILYYWTEMLTAVKHIHDNGVIHSDLKPANFLLVRGRLKLIDFGIASTVNADMTSVVKNTSLGTLNYISPEAINDIGGNGDSPSDDNQYKINFKSDVWSLGCILYSLVYGQTPFQHIRANWAKASAITNPNQKIAFPPPESTTRRGYTPPPPFLVDVMRRCLQHDRKARPSVSQLLQIPYVGCNCPPVSSLPSIPPSILSKIKHSLEESEWRQLLEALERRKPLQ